MRGQNRSCRGEARDEASGESWDVFSAVGHRLSWNEPLADACGATLHIPGPGVQGPVACTCWWGAVFQRSKGTSSSSRTQQREEEKKKPCEGQQAGLSPGDLTFFSCPPPIPPSSPSPAPCPPRKEK